MTVYHRQHIQKLVQMVIKVVGANPHGWLANLAGLLWRRLRNPFDLVHRFELAGLLIPDQQPAPRRRRNRRRADDSSPFSTAAFTKGKVIRFLQGQFHRGEFQLAQIGILVIAPRARGIASAAGAIWLIQRPMKSLTTGAPRRWQRP